MTTIAMTRLFTLAIALVGSSVSPSCATADQSGGPQRSGPPTGAQKHHGNGTPNGGNAAPTLPPLPPLPTLPPLPAFPSLLLGGPSPAHRTPCVCGVFLSSQVAKGAAGKQPTGHAALLHEHDEWTGPCNALGTKTCTNKCLEIIAKHLPNSPAIICGSVDRDVYKERAHLFVKNCHDSWINTLLSSGKEYCCKDGHYYKCPL